MRKIILAGLISLSCIFSSLYAFSWSGIVDNETKLSANHDFNEIGLDQSNGVFFSFNTHFGEKKDVKFVSEVLYKYEFNCQFKEKETDLKNIADCNLLKFSGDMNLWDGLLSWNAGRFKFSDFSGAVFSQTSDGAYVSYNSLKMKASAYAGYTGLLNRLNVSMVENEIKDGDQIYALCPKYIPLAADFSYKGLFEDHTAGIQLECFVPASDDYKLKAYTTLIMNGFFGTLVSYDARLTLGTEEFDGLMLDAKFDANYYATKNAMV